MFVGYLQRMWAYLQIIWVKAAFYVEPMWAESRDVCGSEGLRLGAATGTRQMVVLLGFRNRVWLFYSD